MNVRCVEKSARMFYDFFMRLALPHALSSTIACITLRPSLSAFSDSCAVKLPDEPESSTQTQSRWLASSSKKLRELSDAPSVIRGSVTESGMPVIKVLCPKTRVLALFKVIAAAKNELNVVLDNKAVQLQLQQPELQAAAINVLQTTLTEAGWLPLNSMTFMRCRMSHFRRGQLHECEHITIGSHPSDSDQEFVARIEPGWARFRPFSINSILPEAVGMQSPSISASDAALLNAQLSTMQIMCTVLPDCRPALVVCIQLKVGSEEDKQTEWLLEAGVELPKEVPYYLKVRLSDNVDAPAVVVPSCCVLSSSGVNIRPATARNGIGEKVLRSLAGDLDGSTFRFWGENNFTIHQLQHVEEQQQQQQKGSPWQTAKELAGQTAENDEQQPLSLGPALNLSRLLDDMTNAAQRRCVPNTELKSFLSTVSLGGRSHGQQSQNEEPSGPACAPILLRRAPVQSPAHCTPSRCKAAPQVMIIEQQRESVQVRAAEQCDAAFKTPKAPAKPALAPRKRPGTALKAKAPPAQLRKTDAAPTQRMLAAPHQTVHAPAEHIPEAAPQALPTSTKPAPPQLNTTKRAAAGAGVSQTAAPVVKKLPKQTKTDEAGAAAEAKAPRSRGKAADLDLAAVEAKVEAKHAERQLDKLSIPEIKCYLKAKKLPVGGKKTDLVARLAECMKGGK